MDLEFPGFQFQSFGNQETSENPETKGNLPEAR